MSLHASPAPAQSGWELVMIEQRGCVYCIRWHADVGPEYPITPEGRFAPLRVVDLRALPDDLTLARRPVFTPTFILTRDGQEIGRIEGYPGEDFFWGLLGHLLAQGDADWASLPVDG
ncbi:MAG: hypothetical protein O3A97_07255 [Proteobacteria bacterium]|nr:hypothetical protein [Pseudomonadota bacterium]